jgi:hypothetical protein
MGTLIAYCDREIDTSERIVVQLRKIAPAISAGEQPMDLMEATRTQPHRQARWMTYGARAFTLAVAFSATALVLHLLIGDPRRLYAEGRSEKLAQLHEWSKRISVVAVGTSRVEEGFDPATFDASFAAGRSGSTSFNLGLPGGSQSEERFTGQEAIRALESSNTKSDRIVLLELNAGVNFPPDDVLHPRAINIYSADTISFSYDFNGDGMGVKRLGRLAFAVIAGAAHYANAGMLSALVFRSGNANNPEVALAATRGQRFTPASQQDIQDADEALHARGAPEMPVAMTLTPGNYQLLADVAKAEAPASHVQLVYVVTPTLGDLTSDAAYPEEVEGPNGLIPIINLARPDLYPELYQRTYWRNAGHVNAAGAAVFTRLLALQLDAWLRRHEPR